MKKITRHKLNKFLEKYKSDKLTLDLGCKDSPYKELFPNRIGLDVEPGAGVDVVGDAHSLPFEDNKFETIVCTEVLEHLHSPLMAIKEMKRVLKPDGLLILTTRFIFPLHDAPNDYYRFTKYGLKYLFKDWEIVELREETDSVTGIGILFERLLLQTDSRHRVFKTVWLFLRWVLPKLRYFVKNEYEDINRKNKENNIITSGYYLVCKKIKYN